MRTYTVETIRSGQPRPYADSEYECRITVKERAEWGPQKGQMVPWVLYGDVEARIKQEEQDRAQKRLIGGEMPDAMRKRQADWAKTIVRTLFHEFREKDDADGRTGMAAYFYPTLKWLRIDATNGQITAFIVAPYTD